MRVKFDVTSLQCWANFSGDYNPIHFDDQEAKNIGLSGVVAHGMLAMMPLKNHISLVPLVNSEHDGYHWQASLRLPLHLETAYQLEFKTPDDSAKSVFTLYNSSDNRVKPLIGFFAPVKFSLYAEQLTSLPTDRFQIPPGVMAEKRNEYRQQFPQVKSLWVFIDSLVFSLFMAKGELLIKQREFSELMGTDIQSKVLFLHVTHAVTFSQDIAMLLLMHHITQMSYSIQVKETFFVEKALHCTFVIPVWINGKLVMMIEISVMGVKSAN